MVGADADPSLTADEAGQLAMLQTVLVGVGAGATAALLFAVASGTALSLLLALLAPLPILVVVSLIVTFGTEWQNFQAGLRKVTEEIAELQAKAGHDPAAAERLTTKEMIDALTAAIPGAVAVFATLINCFNLWLAGRIVHV